MVAPLDISVLVSQLPHLQKMQNAEQFHPEAMQTQLSRKALEKQIRERGLVPRAERGEASQKVSRDGNTRQGFAGGRQGGQKDSEEEAHDQPETEPGHIIDLSV